jgi:hypothetical protein
MEAELNILYFAPNYGISSPLSIILKGHPMAVLCKIDLKLN